MLVNNLKIYSDGGSRGNPGPAASAFVVIKDGKIIHKEKKYIGITTNNVAEYNAILMSVEWLFKNFNTKLVKVVHYLDSELAANQLGGKYKVKSKNLIPFVTKIKKLLKNYNGIVNYVAVRRDRNKLSDTLVNESLDENI